MALAGEGRDPGMPHILRLAEQAAVPRREALAILDAVRTAVARWSEFDDQAGVSRHSRQRIARAFPKLGRTIRPAGLRALTSIAVRG